MQSELTLEQTNTVPEQLDSTLDTKGLWGHPRGLTTLFFTEMWERFSFYGMRAILVLYMVAPHTEGGLGFSIKSAAMIYGTYQMLCYLLSMPGGLIADRYIGARRAVLYGGLTIALGNLFLVFSSIPMFYLGLLTIVLGTGLLKPNISTMLGSLYGQHDHRRDGGFSLFYMGINIGAAIAPLACGYLAQSEHFKVWLKSVGFSPLSCWHWGFAVACVGMLCGLAQYLLHRERLKHVGNAPTKSNLVAAAETIAQSTEHQHAAPDQTLKPGQLLTAEEWKRVGAMGILFLFTILFWAVYEQAGSSLTLFADKLTRHEMFGIEFPSTWFQCFNPIFVMFLAPVFSILWVKLGDKEPSSPAKFTYGLIFLAIGIGIMIPAAMLTAHGLVSPLWLVAVYLVECIGELCLSPVGLSTVTKLAPQRFLGFFMGLWFLATALGDFSAGIIASFFDTNSAHMVSMFGMMALACLATGVMLALLTPSVRKLMSGVH